jgi:hypothetical protein
MAVCAEKSFALKAWEFGLKLKQHKNNLIPEKENMTRDRRRDTTTRPIQEN